MQRQRRARPIAISPSSLSVPANTVRANTGPLPKQAACAFPGVTMTAYVESHVRRLEALRRAGIVERVGADRWLIPDGFEARAKAYDSGQGRRASMRSSRPTISTAR